MEGTTAAPSAAPSTDPQLKAGAIGYISSVVIGVASTAPGYSLAAVLGGIVAIQGVGVHAPAIMIVSFVPILFVAWGYRYLNRADPDCGTTFSWAAKAFGPTTGWIGGWAIIVADIIVMANLAQIAGLYTFLLFDSSYAPSTFLVTLVGVVWIAVMTWICVIGIELNAKTQRWLLTAEIVTLAAFAIVALIRVYVDGPANSIHPDISWFSPFAIGSTDALVAGVLIGIFIYWGWDSLVTVNEETEDADTVPGKAAIDLHADPARDLRDRLDGGRRLRRDRAAGQRLDRRRARPAGQQRLRLGPARQARHHRGAQLGGGVDADHDPADRADDAVDGAQGRDPGAASRASTGSTSRPTSRRSGWGRCRSSGTSG